MRQIHFRPTKIVVMADKQDNSSVFGEIVKIAKDSVNDVFLIIKCLESTYLPHYHSFHLQNVDSPVLCIFN